MAITIDQSLDDFASNPEIKDRQVGLVSGPRKNVVAALAGELSLHLDEPLKGSALITFWGVDYQLNICYNDDRLMP